ncbi:TIGR03756 family integrating conjugative element protein, partial [Klebsiella pneumoniae]|nr:TIGR03756 family integrating conjugative element protein [Klebsiella pneumoniae]
MNTKPSRVRTTVCSLAVATVLGTATAPAAVAALNTAQIIASAVSQNCISWRVSGIC